MLAADAVPNCIVLLAIFGNDSIDVYFKCSAPKLSKAKWAYKLEYVRPFDTSHLTHTRTPT